MHKLIDRYRARRATEKDTQMADSPSRPNTDHDAGVGPDGGSSTSTPRWVPVVGIVIAIGVVLLVVVLHLTGTLGPGAH